MMAEQGGSAWAIPVTLLAAIVLTLMPLPDWAVAWRPAWTAMVLIYWCMAVPDRVGIGAAWGIGLVLDALEGSLLGQHAAGFAIIAYLTVTNHRRLRTFSWFQQSLCVGLLVATNALLKILGPRNHGLNPELRDPLVARHLEHGVLAMALSGVARYAPQTRHRLTGFTRGFRGSIPIGVELLKGAS